MTCVSPYLAGGLTRSQCANENLLEGMGGEIMRPAPFSSKHTLFKSSMNVVIKWKQLNSYIDSLNTELCSHRRDRSTHFK